MWLPLFSVNHFSPPPALENWLIKLPLGDQNKLLGWGKMVMDGMEEIMGKGVTTLCSGPHPEAKVSKIRVTSHILWLGFWEPPRNFGTMKTNMFHLWSHMFQICSFGKKKPLSIQEKKSPPKPSRIVECVSPYKIALFFVKSKQQINIQIMRHTEKVSEMEADLGHWLPLRKQSLSCL